MQANTLYLNFTPCVRVPPCSLFFLSFYTPGGQDFQVLKKMTQTNDADEVREAVRVAMEENRKAGAKKAGGAGWEGQKEDAQTHNRERTKHYFLHFDRINFFKYGLSIFI